MIASTGVENNRCSVRLEALVRCTVSFNLMRSTMRSALRFMCEPQKQSDVSVEGGAVEREPGEESVCVGGGLS